MGGDQADSVVRRWLYGERFDDFVSQSATEILGELTQRAGGDLDLTQNNAWQEQIAILKTLQLPDSERSSAKIYFEYTIPRLGQRADVILIVAHVLFVLEFKAGESQFHVSALDQVWDYALDLKNFHDASHGICIAPVLVATKAKPQTIDLQRTPHDDDLLRPVRANADDLHEVIAQTMDFLTGPRIDISRWERGRYLPTPTIIEAARALYAGHSVESISRSDAGAQNLASTSKAIDQSIEPGKDAKTIVGGVATLEIPAADAEVMARGKAQGEVQLALRSYADIGGPPGRGGTARATAQAVRVFRGGEVTEVATP